MLQSLLWDDEVREADFDVLDTDVRTSANELKMASALVDNLSADFAPDKFSDEYQEQLRQLVAAKLEQGDALDTAATFGEESEGESGADVIDLMEALRRSVEANRAKQGAASGSASAESAKKAVPAKKTPAKKAPAKKAPAKRTVSKSTAKKAPAKRTAAKKSPAKKTKAS